MTNRKQAFIFTLLLPLIIGVTSCKPPMKSKDNPIYLDKNDPVFKTIHGRVKNDLMQRSDTDSLNNVIIAKKIEALTTEQQNQLESVLVKSINDYMAQTHFDGTFMVSFSALRNMDQQEISEVYELRIQNLGGGKYAAEFWENGKQEPNSKVLALLYILKKDGSILYSNPYQKVMKFLNRL